MLTHPETLESLRLAALRIFNGAMAACSVEKAFRSRVLPSEPERPHLLRLQGGEDINLSATKRLLLIAVGKGASPMLMALLEQLHIPEHCDVEGVLIAPSRPLGLPPDVAFFAGGHPLPNDDSLAGAKAALALLAQARKDPRVEHTFCVFLVSGGASAMMDLPLDEDIPLSDLLSFHRTLVHSGATIAEMNCVRKHFSAVKGGRLGLAAKGIPNITIAVSDVPKGHLDALGSGPTLPDASTVEQCRAILARYGLLRQFPSSVSSFFGSDRLTETPKNSTLSARVYTLLSEDHLAEAARLEAETLGFCTVVDQGCDDWDFRDAAQYLLRNLHSAGETGARVCLISPGEVTVSLPDSGEGITVTPIGLGGRNQQFALYAATLLQPEGRPTVVLSMGSDGIDGNSSAAGAIVDNAMLAGAMGLETRDAAKRALLDFDAYTFLTTRGDTVVTGPTGNNLRDLRILLMGAAGPSQDQSASVTRGEVTP